MDESKPSLAWIDVEIPEHKWIFEIFSKYRDVEVDVLNFLPYDFDKFMGNVIFEIKHYNIDQIIEDIQTYPAIFEFSVVEKEDTRAIFNIKSKNPDLLYSVIKCGILIEFPIKMREGTMVWKVLATRERIDKLLTMFEHQGINFSLIKIRNSPYNTDDDKSKLSLEESKILNAAISSGFFEVPRRISLEALADSLGKSKSHTSVMLRKIIKKKVMLENRSFLRT